MQFTMAGLVFLRAVLCPKKKEYNMLMLTAPIAKTKNNEEAKKNESTPGFSPGVARHVSRVSLHHVSGRKERRSLAHAVDEEKGRKTKKENEDKRKRKRRKSNGR